MLEKVTFGNPDCDVCGGEGVVDYARGEDSYQDFCDKCFPHGYEPDVPEDDD